MLDTALALQLSQAGLILAGGAARLPRRADPPRARARRHALRRPHPRDPRRADHLRHQAGRLRLRGATATCSRLERAVEGVSVGRAVRRRRHLRRERPGGRGGRARRGSGSAREDVSTQVVPRDRHAELLEAIALAGAGLERFATEMRHLQRTEVREVEEPFRAGARRARRRCRTSATRSSRERITGIARLLRGYAQAGLEDVALWHERDISHSSVERVALPDATILLDYAQHLAIRVVDGMTVHADRMRANLERHPRRAVLPARAARAGGGGPLARRGLPDRPGERPARVGHGHAVPRAARRGRARARPRRGLRPAARSCATPRTIVGRLDRIG